MMKKRIFINALYGTMAAVAAMGATSCGSDDKNEPSGGDNGKDPVETTDKSLVNAERAIEIIDAAVENYFEGAGMSMARLYNPYNNKRSDELGSVWMYTSSIEAVNSVLKAMKEQKAAGKSALYDAHFTRYTQLLSDLVDNLEFYAGTYTLTSYTGTTTWTVYGVNSGSGKGAADVTGVLNVYYDQMWIVRELLEAYEVTGEKRYLDKAEYLTAYVLDGWDCTLYENGRQHCGITWGPGYVTKHSCSNGPIVAPLVKLADIYKGKSDDITYGVILEGKKRGKETKAKADYYLEMAAAVYDYQMTHLYDPKTGLFSDMMGGDDNGGKVRYETVRGVEYRAYVHLRDRVGTIFSYNTGTMISGAAALYKATSDAKYLTEMKSLCDKSFPYFAKPATGKDGCYTFDITGFNNWFNNVLERSYVDAAAAYPEAGVYAEAFQANLDYAYSNYLYNHMLPTNLLVGWNMERSKNNVEGMFTFSFAAEYASLAEYQLTK